MSPIWEIWAYFLLGCEGLRRIKMRAKIKRGWRATESFTHLVKQCQEHRICALDGDCFLGCTKNKTL